MTVVLLIVNKLFLSYSVGLENRLQGVDQPIYAKTNAAH